MLITLTVALFVIAIVPDTNCSYHRHLSHSLIKDFCSLFYVSVSSREGGGNSITKHTGVAGRSDSKTPKYLSKNSKI